MGATPNSKRVRRNEIAKATKNCSYCPPHGKENASRAQRPDKYKTQRRGRAGG